MASSSDDSSVADLSEPLLQTEDTLKAFVAKGNHRVRLGSFQVWPADHEGTKYLTIQFQYTVGGDSYPIMIVAVAERQSLLGQTVHLARDQTRAKFAFRQQSSKYYLGAINGENGKIIIYTTTKQGTMKVQGTYTLDSFDKAGPLQDQFFDLLRHNALECILQID
ncbi:hypothetical protein PMIN06_010469 [Paraphaeosphaeria minitans]|uniref:Uncharacterized protein n=1 Tax=Paraphaeosphaeria minitans TaxID=565426 RepID=A0A9P6GDP3_9PLEO|nr:hypothetical protein PMIN01_08175 [Paraphaeosphaeria minitans]